MNRVIPGILMVLGWLLVAFGPVWLLKALVLVIAFLALREYFAMTMPEPAGYNRTLAPLVALLPILSVAIIGSPRALLLGGAAALFGFVGKALQEYGKIDVLRFLGTAAFGVLYIGLGSVSLILLGQQPQKALWLIFLVAITAGSDTGAYYAGRRFGTTKIFPVLSPKKTWAGLWGGLAAGVLCAAFVHGFMGGPWASHNLVCGAILLVLAGVFGDLAESMLKRACGVKDSGTILAGHGGVLDRIDSMLFVAPLLCYFVLL